MLAAMFDESRGHQCKPTTDGSYFLDRDPKYFRPILNFLRTNQVHIDGNVSASAVLEEAKYFNVIPMQIEILRLLQNDMLLNVDLSPNQISQLLSLQNQENQVSDNELVVLPSAGIASSKLYEQPNKIRAEITRKELIQIIAAAGLEARLRLSGVCFAYQGAFSFFLIVIHFVKRVYVWHEERSFWVGFR